MEMNLFRNNHSRLLLASLLSQLHAGVGGSSCLLLPGRVAVLGCCAGPHLVSLAAAAELRTTSVFSCVACRGAARRRRSNKISGHSKDFC